MTAARPLEHLLVLDLTRVLAGPYCTMMLADMGARVIKIEHPEHGDDSRSFPPFVDDTSAYFASVNRGKESLCLDLKHAHAVETLRQLVGKADVLVENYTPGVMLRLGLQYEVLHALNPRLIYASCTGFGQTGPYAARPAYDLIIQGMGGLMSITGAADAEPTKAGNSVADIFAGTFTCIGVLAALQQRERSGLGQHVDVAMLDSIVATLENAVARSAATSQAPTRIGNRHSSVAPFCSVRTQDGDINIACGNDATWLRFCEATGLTQLPSDPRFTSMQLRVDNNVALETIINTHMQERSSEEWLRRLHASNVPCGPINSVLEVLADPQLLDRQAFMCTELGNGRSLTTSALPIHFSASSRQQSARVPELGQHGAEILRELLGYDDAAISQVLKGGTVYEASL